jgi:hypothetical protein
MNGTRTMNVTTNNHWRDFLYRYEVPAGVLVSEFDWLDRDEQDGFFRYRGVWYHLSMFLRTAIEGWDGIYNDSMFSGVLIEVSSDAEQYRIGTAIS